MSLDVLSKKLAEFDDARLPLELHVPVVPTKPSPVDQQINKVHPSVVLLAISFALASPGIVIEYLPQSVPTIVTVSYTHLTLPTNREV